MGKLSGGGADSGGSSSNYPGWVGYIEFDDETGEAIAADYSGLELQTPTPGLKFEKKKFRGDWIGDLTYLTNGYSMFYGCTNLTSFTGDLSSLTSGNAMFSGCSNLTSFTGDLSSLTDGSDMFYGCRLDKLSVTNIINCLKERNINSQNSKLSLGIDKNLKSDTDFLEMLGISSVPSSSAYSNGNIIGFGGGTWTIAVQWV